MKYLNGSTVANLLSHFRDEFQLVAGHRGLERVFNAVLVADQEIPSTFSKQLVIVGENLTRTAYKSRTLADVFTDFYKKDATALCVHQAERWLDDSVVTWADEAGLPIISVAPEQPWDDCYRLIYHYLLQHSNRVAESHDQLESFLDHVLKSTDPLVILSYLHKLIDKPVFHYDHRCQLKHKVGTDRLPPTIIDAVSNFLLQQRSSLQVENSRVIVQLSSDYEMSIKPFHSTTSCLGYLVILYPPAQADAMDWIAVHHASTALALQSIHHLYNEQQRDHRRHSFIYDLLFGRYQSVALLEPRAVEIGFNMNVPHRTILVQLHHSHEQHFFKSLSSIVDLLSFLFQTPLLQTSFGQGLIVFVPASIDSEQFMKKMIQEVEKRFRHYPALYCGISSPAMKPGEYPRSLDEAMQAINIGRSVFPDETIFHYENLGVYRLFAEINKMDKRLLADFSHEVLADIIDREELIGTLDSFFSAGGSTEKAAEQLYVHGNTVRYRLKKIEQLTGLSLNNPEDAFMLQFALKLNRFLGTAPS